MVHLRKRDNMDNKTREFLSEHLVECRRALKNRVAVALADEMCDISVKERHNHYLSKVRELIEVTYYKYSSTDAYIQNAFYLADLQIDELITDEDFIVLERYNIELHEREVEYERRRNFNG